MRFFESEINEIKYQVYTTKSTKQFLKLSDFRQIILNVWIKFWVIIHSGGTIFVLIKGEKHQSFYFVPVFNNIILSI